MIENTRRILIVDDNPDIHEDLKTILQPETDSADALTASLEEEIFEEEQNTSAAAGTVGVMYQIDDAFQGEAALQMTAEAQEAGNPYALVFMDVRMPPGIDGIETIQRLWKICPYTEVVLCTAYSDYSWNQLADLFGGTDHLLFLKKPFDVVAVKQVALTMTTKWELDKANRAHVLNLESEVQAKTRDLSTANEKLEEKNRELVDFTHTIVHDLKNPLSNVYSILSDLKGGVSGGEQSRDIVEGIEALQYMSDLLKDLSDASLLDSDSQDLFLQEVNVQKIVYRVVSRFASKIKKKKIEIVVDADVILIADKKALNKVFMNLVGNAVNYMGSGDAPQIHIVASREKNAVTITVKDTGIGIPTDQQKIIFKKFKRGNNVQDLPGTGLGLAIVKGYVEAHGGTIVVESGPGKGTCFFLTFPLLKKT